MITNKDLIRVKLIESGEKEIDEGLLGTTLKVLGPVGTAYQGYQTYQRLKKGDYPGAALSATAALPGPVGWAATAADIARGEKDGEEPEKPKEPEPVKPTETKPAEPPQQFISQQPKSDFLQKANIGTIGTRVQPESGGRTIKTFKQFHKK